MTRTRFWGLWVLCVGGVVGCGGGRAEPGARAPVMAPATDGAGYAEEPAPPSAPPSKATADGYDAPPPLAESAGAARAGAELAPGAPRAAAPSERPGLATSWGETRYSRVSTTRFVRADPEHPMAVAKLFYDDEAGARRMADADGYRPLPVGAASVAGEGLTVELRDGRDEPLAGFVTAGRTYAIGEAGQRYTIVVRNRTGYRFEAVASVDGLDVMDGRDASFEKRGYLVGPWTTVTIDGFRRSDDEVAAFRFGSVADSYAARTGSDRNVGIVGVAFFHERGSSPWRSIGPLDDEVRLRRSADPFPGRYASPPPPRW